MQVLVSRCSGPKKLLLMVKFLLHRFISVLHKSGIKRRRMRCNDSVFPRSFHNTARAQMKNAMGSMGGRLSIVYFLNSSSSNPRGIMQYVPTPDNKFNAFHFTLLCAQFSLLFRLLMKNIVVSKYLYTFIYRCLNYLLNGGRSQFIYKY